MNNQNKPCTPKPFPLLDAVVDPSSSVTGPMLCRTKWKAVRRKRQRIRECSIASCRPSSGHAVPRGCHPVRRTPTARQRACCINVMSTSGRWSLVHSFPVWGDCCGGSRFRAIKYRSLTLLFQPEHDTQLIILRGQRPLGGEGRSLGVCPCTQTPRFWAGVLWGDLLFRTECSSANQCCFA